VPTIATTLHTDTIHEVTHTFNDGAPSPGQKFADPPFLPAPASSIDSPPPPPQPPPSPPQLTKTNNGVPRAPSSHVFNASTPVRQYASMPLRQYASTSVRQYAITPVCQYNSTPVRHYAITPVRQYASMPLHICSHPTISTVFPTINKVPSALSPAQMSQPPQDSPIRFSLPSEEDVLGFKEDILGFHFTDFPPGLLSSECAGAVSPCAVADLDFHKDAWTTKIRAQLPQLLHLHDSLVHIVARPHVCGILGNGTRVYAITATADTPIHRLCDSGANLCMTINPNILVNVRPCKPFTISLATTDGGHSHTNACRSSLLPLPLLDGTSYYQTCFVNPYA
jgi:hypothetical protein